MRKLDAEALAIVGSVIGFVCIPGSLWLAPWQEVFTIFFWSAIGISLLLLGLALWKTVWERNETNMR